MDFGLVEPLALVAYVTLAVMLVFGALVLARSGPQRGANPASCGWQRSHGVTK
jgi:hypothetical protein